MDEDKHFKKLCILAEEIGALNGIVDIIHMQYKLGRIPNKHDIERLKEIAKNQHEILNSWYL